MPVNGRWLAGLSLAVLNCTLSSVGIIMQRKAGLLSEQKQVSGDLLRRHEQISDQSLRILWCGGIIFYILAAVPDVIAYALVPQVVCTTVACFRLVVITAIGHFILYEHVQGREVLGMIGCSLGTALCLIFGPSSSETPTVEGAFFHAEVASYLTVGAVVLAGLLLMEHLEELGCKWSGQQFQRVHVFALPMATGLAYGLEKVFNTEIGFITSPEGLPWGFIKEPQWAAMVSAIGLLGLMDFYLNVRGAQRMPVKVFVPVTFAFATTLQFVQSVVIFGEFKDSSFLEMTISVFGACLLLAGAICLQPPRFALLDGTQPGDEPETSCASDFEMTGQTKSLRTNSV